MNFNQPSKAFFASFLTTTATNEVLESKEEDIKTREETRSKNQSRSKLLRRQMTSIGRFSLSSQTEQNPSIISFFVALVHGDEHDLNLETFNDLWRERIMSKYERFRFHVSKEDTSYFEMKEQPMMNYITKVTHPKGNGENFKERIKSMQMTPMDVNKGLWEAQLSSGDLGSSGALKEVDFPNRKIMPRESLVLFRVHHSLCDAVSLSVAIGDLADESKELKEKISREISKRTNEAKKLQKSFIINLFVIVAIMSRLLLKGMLALLHQFWRVAIASSPFDDIMKSSTIPPGERSVAWRDLDSLQEIKLETKRVSPSMTINDLVVHLVTYAVQRQLDEHLKKGKKKETIGDSRRASFVNIVIPVHLNGGLIKGTDLGNKIGAFVSTIPLPRHESNSILRAKKISNILHRGKSSPAALISWWLAKFSSDFAPDWWTKFIMRKFNAKSVAVVSNVKGWPFQVHWLGRRVDFLCAFLPLPPGIPIGIVLQSYSGKVSFSINADKRAVPDAEIFADWMLDEYKYLLDQGHSKMN